MRYVVYGAGAIGGTIGGRLFQAGQDVTLIARGAHLEALRDRGLTLRDPEHEATLPIRAEPDPTAAGVTSDDVVVLAMKTQDTPGALAALAALGDDGSGARIVCAQNGVDNERQALRRFPYVYGMCVMLPAAHLEPGVVDVYSTPTAGILDTGRYPTGADDVVERITADLRAAGFESEPDVAVMRRKYGKLLMNLGNALEAACGPTHWEQLGPLLERARAEARAVYAAGQIAVTSDEEDRARRGDTLKIRPIAGARRGGGSSWQSLARGTGTIEADWLNGEIVLLGRLHGVPTPVNEALQRLGDRIAREKRDPGTVPVDEVLAAVG
jgi:2-dehydropantoate 2-reductase